MDFQEAAAWIAPIATMIAAMMTAANLGSRITGWGFVVFVIGSIAWSAVGLASGQTNLVATNVFLTLVNLIGVWRWLVRQARYDDGGQKAARHSGRAGVPSLFSANGVIGASVKGCDQEELGTVVDAMMVCDTMKLAYVVVAAGGVVGVSERLYALNPVTLRFTANGILADMSMADLEALPLLKPDHWPLSL